MNLLVYINRIIARLMLALLLFVPAQGLADDNDADRKPMSLYNRCIVDLLDQELAWRRIGWARKCGYINSEEAEFMAGHERYPTFGNPGAALDPAAPCFPPGVEVTIIGDCKVKGCYPEDQQVLFGRSYLTLPDAYHGNVSTVTAARRENFTRDIETTTEQPIEAFVTGEEHGLLYRIFTESRLELTVTARHPLIEASGEIIRADAIVPGCTQLLTVLGPSSVTRVEAMPFDGMVWNVQPASSEVADNVLFAQGFLTGSVRFQNEWEEDDSRLRVRDHVDLRDFLAADECLPEGEAT